MSHYDYPFARLSAANSGQRAIENRVVNQLRIESWAEDQSSTYSQRSDDKCSEHSIAGGSRLKSLRDCAPREYEPSESGSSNCLSSDESSESEASFSGGSDAEPTFSKNAIPVGIDGRPYVPDPRADPREHNDDDIKPQLHLFSPEKRAAYHSKIGTFNANIQREKVEVDRLHKAYVLRLVARIAHHNRLRHKGKPVTAADMSSLKKSLKFEKIWYEEEFLNSASLDKDAGFQKEVDAQVSALLQGHNGERTVRYERRLRDEDEALCVSLMLARDSYYQVGGARMVFIQAVRDDLMATLEEKKLTGGAPKQIEQ